MGPRHDFHLKLKHGPGATKVHKVNKVNKVNKANKVKSVVVLIHFINFVNIINFINFISAGPVLEFKMKIKSGSHFINIITGEFLALVHVPGGVHRSLR